MKLLLIEDDTRLADIARRGLRAEGYLVEVAADASSGWELAFQKDIDLILLDVMLPDEDGVSLCRRLRGAGVATPVLMLTALDAVADRVGGLRGGADDYLVKPYAFEELLARIEALGRRSSQPISPMQSAIMEYGDLAFDRETMRATRGREAIALTPKEIGILILLLERPGAIVSRERILREVWSTDTDPMTNIVDVYLGRLRRKIAEHGPPMIETVRGFGYRLIE